LSATPHQRHLGSDRARPLFARAFRRRASTAKDTSGRLLQSHMSNTSTRCFARLPSRYRSCPRCALVDPAVHAAGPASADVFSTLATTSVVFSPRAWCACASDASSPPALRQHAANSTRTIKTASTAAVHDYDSFLSPRTPSSGKKLFTSFSQVPQPESPRLDPDLDVASPATVLSAAD